MTNYYTDLQQVQEELRSEVSFSNNTLPSAQTVTRWIGQASERVDNIAGRTFGVTTYVEYIDYNGEEMLMLKHAPFTTVTSVEYNDQPSGQPTNWATLTADTSYVVYPETGEILIVLDQWKPNFGNRNIRITYSAGFTDIPELIQTAVTKIVALRVLNTLISKNVNEGSDGGSISVGSISIVEPASYGVNSYRNLQQEVKDLLDNEVKNCGIRRY
jgi:hypothetical protein